MHRKGYSFEEDYVMCMGTDLVCSLVYVMKFKLQILSTLSFVNLKFCHLWVEAIIEEFLGSVRVKF